MLYFRKSRSCELAVTELIDSLLNNMDNRVLNGLLLVDLKKAFDLVIIAFFFQNFKSMAVHLPLFSGLLLISLTVLNVLA